MPVPDNSADKFRNADGSTDPILSVRDLRTYFHTDSGVVKAVDGVSFDVRKGEVLGIVGESGSGKSVTAMTILGLLQVPPAKIESGQVLWKGQDLLKMTDRDLRKVRGAQISMIFQDPMTSLNPVYTVGNQISEMITTHQSVSKADAKKRTIAMLDLVGIPRAAQRADDYPHQFSGGMRQRAMIAMALACEPELLICDEPTTALDVTIQAQVLEVIERSARELGAAILLITHDLGVVAGMTDRVNVMYAGQIVETGTVDEVYYEPQMPYTWGLLSSIPRHDAEPGSRLNPIPGAPPVMSRPPAGCRFHPRCAHRIDACVEAVPELAEIPGLSSGHLGRCERIGEAGWADRFVARSNEGAR
jgi:oligopeptide transport system ATP-binding protein